MPARALPDVGIGVRLVTSVDINDGRRTVTEMVSVLCGSGAGGGSGGNGATAWTRIVALETDAAAGVALGAEALEDVGAALGSVEVPLITGVA